MQNNYYTHITKIFLCCFVLFINIGLMAQDKVAQKVLANNNFKTYKITELVKEKSVSQSFKNIDKKSTLATFNINIINDIKQKKNKSIEMEIPYDGKTITVQLYSVNLFHEKFHLDSDKQKNIAYQQGTYYRGIIKGDKHSLVSFNFFNNECNGVISSSKLGNIAIAKSNASKLSNEYLIYSDSSLKKPTDVYCQTKDEAVNQKVNKFSKNILTTRCVTVYFEMAYSLFVANGNDVTAATNWMSSVFNNVQTLYANEGINVSLKSLYIWTTQDSYSGTDSLEFLNQFHTNRPVFDGDVGQLLTKNTENLGGIAATANGLCSSYNYSYSDVLYSYSSVPTFSWTVQVIAHELGHLLGSPHTHACAWNGNNTAIDGCYTTEGGCNPGPVPSAATGGTIMSYCHLVTGVGINFANGFGTQPAELMRNTVNNATCLSTDCLTICPNTIVSVKVSNVTTTSVTLEWVTQGSLPVEISISPVSQNSGNWITPNGNSHTFSGLLPNTYYAIIARNVCPAGIEGVITRTVFATNGDYCSGILLTDSGGNKGDYSNNETVTRVIIPNNPNNKATITFTHFDLEDKYDYLYVYNGNNDTYPDLSSGGFTGNSIPNPVQSTAVDGALTIKFYSDQGLVASGYEATISCATLGFNHIDKGIDYSYYPNPTHDKLTIVSKTIVQQIEVYNMQGQLLMTKKGDDTITTVDVSNLAVGTYFFRLKFENSQTSFRVVKDTFRN